MNEQEMAAWMELENQTGDFEYHYGRALHEERTSRVIRNWSSLDDVARWKFEIATPGRFEVAVGYTADPEATGSELEIRVAEQSLPVKVGDGAPSADQEMHRVGQVAIEQPGPYTLQVTSERLVGSRLLQLRRIRISPANSPNRGSTP